MMSFQILISLLGAYLKDLRWVSCCCYCLKMIAPTHERYITHSPFADDKTTYCSVSSLKHLVHQVIFQPNVLLPAVDWLSVNLKKKKSFVTSWRWLDLWTIADILLVLTETKFLILRLDKSLKCTWHYLIWQKIYKDHGVICRIHNLPTD